MNKTISFLFGMFFSSLSLHAGIESDLKGFVEYMGTSGNVTKGGAYHDQSGGYYSGGSIFMRSPSRNVPFFTIEGPSFAMNCTNMDLVLGSFSILSSKQLMDALHGIARNAAAYALQLGLQVVTPQVKAAVDQLMAVLQNVNGMSQNSCLTGQLLAAGLLPKNEAMMKHLCKSKGMSIKIAEDWAGLDQACSTKAADIGNRKVEGFEDVLAGEFNLAWKALQKNEFLKSDEQLASLMMSLSGSLISKKGKGDQFRRMHLPSLMNNQMLIDALIYGGREAEIYVCDDKHEDKCLNPTRKKTALKVEGSLFGKVQGILDGMTTKLREDIPMDKQERAFVNATSLPVMAILAVEAAFRSDGSPIRVSEFSEAIAYDLLLQYFSGVLELVAESLRDLEQVQVDESVIRDFRKDLREAQKLVLDKRNGIYQQMLTQLKTIEHAGQIEAKLHSLFVTLNQGDTE